MKFSPRTETCHGLPKQRFHQFNICHQISQEYFISLIWVFELKLLEYIKTEYLTVKGRQHTEPEFAQIFTIVNRRLRSSGNQPVNLMVQVGISPYLLISGTPTP